ncbi:MAG: tetratricopeptide repeat protein [Candidatus Cloacimonetes bacterium]|nr:tetratricopeptide repeat protein [Candidatus Cloacimonadota bacterium]
MRKILFITIIFTFYLINATDFNFAKNLFDDGLYDEAILELQKIVKEKPTSLEAEKSLFLIGQSYQNINNLTESEKVFKQLLESYPASDFKEKTFYNLANLQFSQNKFTKAVSNYNKLISDYPMSAYSKKSLSNILESHFTLEDYNQTILIGEKLIKNYPEAVLLPEVYLWLAKAYFENNIPNLGKSTLEKITTDFPQSDARWKALDIEFDLVQKKSGLQAGAEFLLGKLKKNIPRKHQEKILWQISEIYVKLNDYNTAYEQIQKLTNKFTSSSYFPKYIYFQTICEFEKGKYDKIISNEKKYLKIFKDSDLKPVYLLKISQAYEFKNRFEKAEEIVNSILQNTTKDSIIAMGKLQLATIYKKDQKAKYALNIYKELLSNYSKYIQTEIIYKDIGEIYSEIFQMYSQAIKYYQKAIIENSENNFQYEANYKLALCYENLERYEEALIELDQINLKNTDEILKNKIINRKEYIRKFKQKNYQIAFEKLLNVMIKEENKTPNLKLRNSLIEILANDLKKYQQSLDLLQNSDNPEHLYLKAILHLKLAEKNKKVGNLTLSETHLAEVSKLIRSLKNLSIIEKSDELSLRKMMITEGSINVVIEKKLSEFIKKYPDSIVANQFIYELSEYYAKSNIGKAIPYWEMLKNEKPVSEQQFSQVKIDLAEYYFLNENMQKSLENYVVASDFINISQPEVYFHYAVSIYEVAIIDSSKFSALQKENAISRLEFLINNSEIFTEFKDAVYFLTKIFRERNDYNNSLKYLLRIPLSKRDDEFYKLLSNDYLAVGEKVKAKETILFIKEKDDELLRILAQFQIETNDFEMAKYSLEQLIKSDKNNLDNYQKLAHIHFLLKDFNNSVKTYQKYINISGEKVVEKKGFENSIKEFIISLLKTNAEQKANQFIKKYKKQISELAKSEIEMHRGIYLSESNPVKSEKIFTKQLKNSTLKDSLRLQTYFWRGITRLKQKKSELAKNDFEKVVFADDQNLVNKANLKLGTIYFSSENYEKALEHYYKVIQHDEKGDLALNATQNFAYVCKTIEEWEKAISAYEIILDRWGSEDLQANTVFDIAFCYYRDKKYTHAIEMFSKALPLLTEKVLQAETQYWLGESYFGLEDYEKAITEFLKVNYNYENQTRWAASAELRAAESYIKLHKIDRAKRVFQRIIDKYGKYSDWGKEAGKRLEVIEG